jgi:AAA+ ATPase superfamily predicted ATPase|tara:strand:+ start:3520 stop:3810 length:291 start_codon:yes stop_codon:yes gene_type:complete
MSNTLEAIHLLEKTLQNLLSNYEFLKRENYILLQSNTELQHKLLETAQNLVNQKKEFDILKIAKTIQGSSSDTKNTKLKINSLIREIDKCIVQLQE